jgi:hypothetical protein
MLVTGSRGFHCGYGQFLAPLQCTALNRRAAVAVQLWGRGPRQVVPGTPRSLLDRYAASGCASSRAAAQSVLSVRPVFTSSQQVCVVVSSIEVDFDRFILPEI